MGFNDLIGFNYSLDINIVNFLSSVMVRVIAANQVIYVQSLVKFAEFL